MNKTDLNKIQSRREFLLKTTGSGVMSGLGFISVFLTDIRLIPNNREKCPENLLCTECYKMGVCENNEAAETRIKIRTNAHAVKKSKGAING